jgi:hypothetical protein
VVNDKPFVIGSLTGEGFYNCSPSFNWKKHLWKKHLDDATIAKLARARRDGIQVSVHLSRS